MEERVNYYGGISGLILPVPNKSHYPEAFRDKSRLCYYASLFNSIEINSSFYKIPQAKTIAKWSNEVPAGFKFTFKLWREITHAKGLNFNPADVQRFMQVIDTIGEKKGCLLIQFPPSAKMALLPRLMYLVRCIREADPARSWPLALEFRHSSWYTESLRDFVAENDLSVVLQDKPRAPTPLDLTDAPTVYLRFHGPGGSYRGSYGDDVLAEYSSYIREWQDEGKTVFVYFNNTMGAAAQNLSTLNAFVQEAGADGGADRENDMGRH
jgi:uncharacterized protein YecE (DUF72 family)